MYHRLRATTRYTTESTVLQSKLAETRGTTNLYQMANIWNTGSTLLKRVVSTPAVNSIRSRVKAVISLKRERRLRPSKRIPLMLKNKRTAPGMGIYAGQISNFDTIDLKFFPLVMPDIRLTPEGTDLKPSKLLAVWRISTLFGQQYWLKEIMEKHLRLTDETRYSTPRIVRNSPSVNQMLWHVKHLIRVRPITFPDGFPTEDDLGSTFLNRNGELKINKEYKYTSEQLVIKPDEKKMDTATLEKILRNRWLEAWDT